MIRFYGDTGELRRITEGIEIAEEAIKKAEVSALNKTITQVRTFIVREVTKDYAVTQKAVRDELKLVKANYSRMEAQVTGSGSPGIPLYTFKPTPSRVPSTRRTGKGGYTPKGGIKVMIHRGSRKQVTGAFVARMGSGHVGVFRRKEQGGIEELYGPSPIRMLDSDRYYEKLDDFTEETLDKHREHEAQYFLKKAGVNLV